MSAGHDGEDSERVEQGTLERLDDVQGRDRKVDLALLDSANQSIAAALDEPYFHLRMPPPIQREYLRHRRLEELRRRTHSKDAALAPASATPGSRSDSASASRRRLRASISRPLAARAIRRPMRSNN
jgi:hypothetical protein